MNIPKKQPQGWIRIGLIAVILIVTLSCSQSDQAFLKTSGAQTAKTAAAGGGSFIETQAEGAGRIADTQSANAATDLASKPLAPWNINWLPVDHQHIIDKIESILNGTGMSGKGSLVLHYGLQYMVNPAFGLAMLRKESNFDQPGTQSNKNNDPGNILASGGCENASAGDICIGLYGEISTDGKWGVFQSLDEGIKAYFMMLNEEYGPSLTNSCTDVACVVTIYCQYTGCDTAPTIDQVSQWTREYQDRILAP